MVDEIPQFGLPKLRIGDLLVHPEPPSQVAAIRRLTKLADERRVRLDVRLVPRQSLVDDVVGLEDDGKGYAQNLPNGRFRQNWSSPPESMQRWTGQEYA